MACLKNAHKAAVFPKRERLQISGSGREGEELCKQCFTCSYRVGTVGCGEAEGRTDGRSE